MAPVVALALMAGAGACAPDVPPPAPQPDLGVAARPGERAPAYLGAEAALLSADLVNMVVRMRDPESTAMIEAYARCAAANFALVQGMGFLRHVRTQFGTERVGVVKADAVYTMSTSLPRGVRTIDAEVVVADCVGRGIPAV
ncbi:hypothetical protein [Rhodovulum strictum]|uniref:Lipoprotein n=1 Tax=Rhodovulum strictum TaxID=58314 RepID=A0A844B2J0_9RHOB|nr:hypothetical protein [Rhodovulum strictum]MRH19980.1 hypothetical protein [Rhodovulum strictum]